MAEYMPPPQFNLGYDVKPMDIGSGYAAGITQAGKSLSDATKGVMDVMTRNQNANDMLTALGPQGAKVLSADEYNSVAGKSLGAKEQLLGMYANQWILDQAAARQMALARGQGGVEVATAHAKMLDIINQMKTGNPVPGQDPSKLYWQPPQQPPQPAANPNAPSPAAVATAQQTAGQYAGGPGPGAGSNPMLPPGQMPAGKPIVPGTRYVQQKDPTTGKVVNGRLLPSGQFIPD